MKYKLKIGKAGASFQGLGADFQHRLRYAELSLHAKSRQTKYYTILWAAIKTSFTDMLLLKWNKINRTDKKSSYWDPMHWDSCFAFWGVWNFNIGSLRGYLLPTCENTSVDKVINEYCELCIYKNFKILSRILYAMFVCH